MWRFVPRHSQQPLKLLPSVRWISVPPSQSHSSTRRQDVNMSMRLNREAALLDAQLRELKQRERLIQASLKDQRDAEKQKMLAQRDGVALTGRASIEEIAALEQSIEKSGLQLFDKKKRKSPIQLLPAAFRKLLQNGEGKELQLFQPKALSWAQIVNRLVSTPDLSTHAAKVSQKEIEKFAVAIPVKQRAALAPQLELLVQGHRDSQFVRDTLMAAYAERGEPETVERIFGECSKPTTYSFGHLAKAYFKIGAAPEKVLDVVRRMTAAGHSPDLLVYSTAVQSLIQHKRYTEAEGVFDNLKYLSVSTQPDTKLYNAMLLAAAKQHNVNRVLDLFSEMKSRRPFPLQPNPETYSILVYACARDPKTHLMAWEMFIEAMNRGVEVTRDSFRALLYLCGSTGEAMLARALVRRLFEREGDAHGYIVDDFVLNSLFLAYKNWQPGPSKIMSTQIGHAIRAHILMDAASPPFVPSLPLLPVSQLDRKLVLAESNAVLEFCADTRPQALRVQNKASTAKVQHSPAVFNNLQVVIQHDDGIEEFKRRFNRFTVLERDSQIVHSQPETHSNLAIARDQDLYRLAIRACIKFKDLTFAREIWVERGEWRKTPAFRDLPQSTRNRLDFQFARDIVEVLAVCGQVEEAQLVLKSALSLGNWRRHHVTALLGVLEQLEDTRSVNDVCRMLRPRRL